MLYCWLDSFIIALFLYIGGYKYEKPPVRMAKYEKGVFWARTITVMTVEVLVFRLGGKAAALKYLNLVGYW